MADTTPIRVRQWDFFGDTLKITLTDMPNTAERADAVTAAVAAFVRVLEEQQRQTPESA